MKFRFGISLIVLTLGAVVWAQSNNKIGAILQKSLQGKGHVDILVTMKDGTERILDNLTTISFSTREERVQALYDALTNHARNSQRKFLRFLSSPSVLQKYGFVNVRSFWISNQISIRMANAEFINHLTTMDEISLIEEDQVMHLQKPTEVSHDSPAINANQWGIDDIKAPEVWNSGNTGAGSTVCVIDTGINPNHTCFAKSFANDGYDWYDATSKGSPTPYDDHGHGSHVCGTVAGGNGVGVAPGAKLRVCKGLLADGSAVESDLTACSQAFICPYRDCSKLCDVASNSWSGGGGYTGFDRVINAWVAAGIIPVFAFGNFGSRCRTGGSPGDRPQVIGVGSTNINHTLSTFSSRGSTADNRIKPEISAPGENVASASHLSNTELVTMSGTSMACPHVAGAIALLLSENRNLTYAEVKDKIQSTTNRAVKNVAACYGTTYTQFPNNMYGYGILDISAAVQKIRDGK